MCVYIVDMIPVKSSKDSYILGVYTSKEAASNAGLKEVSRSDASWWTTFDVIETDLNSSLTLYTSKGNGKS